MGRLDVLIYNLVISQRQFNSRSQNLSHKTTCIYKDESKCYVFAPKLLPGNYNSVGFKFRPVLQSTLDFVEQYTDIGSFIVAFLKL